MQILVDIGNTRIKYCCYESNSFGDLQYLNNTALREEWLNNYWGDAKQIVVASVANTDMPTLIRAWCQRNQVKFTEVKSEAKAYGVVNGYQNPLQLGVDRWLALLGARKLYPKQACLIIDAGTATTVDFVDQDGQHKGGWILAGIRTLIESIQQNTANVVGNDYTIGQQQLGTNTAENLSQAAWSATIGLVEQAKRVIKRNHDSIDKVIVTGGNGNQLSKLINEKVEPNPYLVFYGLACYLI